MKICRECGEEKNLNEYHKHSGAPDGLRYKCKACRKKESQKWWEANSERANKKCVEWHKAHPEKHKVYEANYRKRNPLKVKAHNDLTHAVEAGKVKKLSCEFCGNTKSEAHHEDYSKPLEVIWLCKKCHVKLHKEKSSVL